jgi:hypothetical protein
MKLIVIVLIMIMGMSKNGGTGWRDKPEEGAEYRGVNMVEMHHITIQYCTLYIN